MNFHPSFLFGRSSLLCVILLKGNGLPSAISPRRARPSLALPWHTAYVHVSLWNYSDGPHQAFVSWLNVTRKWGTEEFFQECSRDHVLELRRPSLTVSAQDSWVLLAFWLPEALSKSSLAPRLNIQTVALHFPLRILNFCFSKLELVLAFTINCTVDDANAENRLRLSLAI